MSGQIASLRDPGALIALAERLQVFATSGVAAMNGAEAEMAEVEQWLNERVHYWEREVIGREVDLESCLSDEYADCSYEAAALMEARAELQNAERWTLQVVLARDRYRAGAPRFRAMIEGRCADASRNLLTRATTVGRYSDSAATQAAASRVARSSPAGADAPKPPPMLERYQTHGNTFADIPLSQIEEPQFAPGELEEADFLDMRQSFDRYPEIRQAIADGTIDQFAARDPAARRVYDWFYGGDAVKLDWQNGHFSITNGKHRIFMARQLGLPTLPARVWTP